MKYTRLLVKGTVQGVGYRAFIYRQTAGLPSLKGYVKNLFDGSVEIVLAGNSSDVARIISLAEKGPSGADVREVSVEQVDFENDFGDFTVLY